MNASKPVIILLGETKGNKKENQIEKEWIWNEKIIEVRETFNTLGYN